MVTGHFVLLGPLLVTLTNHVFPPCPKVYILGEHVVTMVAFLLVFRILVIDLRDQGSLQDIVVHLQGSSGGWFVWLGLWRYFIRL